MCHVSWVRLFFLIFSFRWSFSSVLPQMYATVMGFTKSMKSFIFFLSDDPMKYIVTSQFTISRIVIRTFSYFWFHWSSFLFFIPYFNNVIQVLQWNRLFFWYWNHQRFSILKFYHFWAWFADELTRILYNFVFCSRCVICTRN